MGACFDSPRLGFITDEPTQQESDVTLLSRVQKKVVGILIAEALRGGTADNSGVVVFWPKRSNKNKKE